MMTEIMREEISMDQKDETYQKIRNMVKTCLQDNKRQPSNSVIIEPFDHEDFCRHSTNTPRI